MMQKESYWRDTGDHSHGGSASISRLDASLLIEGRECWEEAGEGVMGGGPWENEVQSVPPGTALFLERFVGGVAQQAFFGGGGGGSEEHT